MTRRIFIVIALLPLLACQRPKLSAHLEHRSWHEKHMFEVETGFPNGRPGYIVDHWLALACGGPDIPSNMQWQTIAEAKAKDRIERTPVGCEWYSTHHCPDCGKAQ